MTAQPQLLPDSAFDITLDWLAATGLSACSDTIVSTSSGQGMGLFALPISRKTQRKTHADLERIRRDRPAGASVSPQSIYQEAQLIRRGAIILDYDRYPADAIAFYRPFHYANRDEWGIYFDIEALVTYVTSIWASVKSMVRVFDFESLLIACFFEVFQHEYFHHISECAATTMEIIQAQFGRTKPVYRPYWESRYRGDHLHSPLEEALANAYAYNSLSFLSRVKVGLRTTRIKLYQQALIKHWPKEPAGYREAAHYIDGGYVRGAGELARLMLPNSASPPGALDLVAKEVLLNGNSTFFAKPYIPVRLCGSAEAIKNFDGLLPAPVEAYSSLLWLDDSKAVDAYFEAQRRKPPVQPSA